MKITDLLAGNPAMTSASAFAETQGDMPPAAVLTLKRDDDDIDPRVIGVPGQVKILASVEAVALDAGYLDCIDQEQIMVECHLQRRADAKRLLDIVKTRRP